MRILFWVIGNSRRSNFLNGDTIRTGGAGASGTDTSSILVAEYLASPEGGSHEVVMSVDPLEPLLYQTYTQEGKSFIPGTKYRGVIYTHPTLEGIENKTFDILVNMLWFEDYESLPIQVTKAVIIWCHVQWFYGYDKLVNYLHKYKLRCGIVHISDWAMGFNVQLANLVIQNCPGSKQTMIYNPLLTDIIEQIPIQHNRILGKFIFPVSWGRGGTVSLDTVRSLNIPNKSFYAFDYLMCIHDHRDIFFHKYEGVDKTTLFQHLSNSDYFIYPLYTHYENVHMDTFCCAVAEALALGVIVITYPLAALPEIYKDYCVWLDIPEELSHDDLQRQQLIQDKEGRFKNIQPILDKINYLEQHPEEKEKLRYKGREDILSRFNINTIGQEWVQFINVLLS